jgi:hypothetical protein
MEHNLAGKTKQYPLIVIQECDYIDPSLLNELRTYMQEGGNLLVIGSETATVFARELGIQSADKLEEKDCFISAAGRIGSVRSSVLSVKLTSDCKTLSNFYSGSDYRDKGKQIASSSRQVGKGKIAAIYFDAGKAYSEYKTFVIRDFIAETIAQLAPPMKVEVSGSHLLHVALNKLNGKTYINLMNVAGESTNQAAIGYDQIPALTDISLTIKGKPSKIVLQPEGRVLNFTSAEGKSTVVIPKIEIHSILEVTE